MQYSGVNVPDRTWIPSIELSQYWADKAGCDSVEQRETTEAIYETRTGCNEPVESVLLNSGCHGWPGAIPAWWERMLNCLPSTFEGTKYIAQWIKDNIL
jgi:poly(3-hydroxybutyrate) depolymerase